MHLFHRELALGLLVVLGGCDGVHAFTEHDASESSPTTEEPDALEAPTATEPPSRAARERAADGRQSAYEGLRRLIQR
ncbi:MAG: hypothetical protein KC619_16910 [Myxococcales bacterium]|nr:hypothetical protein [Myxococcales bacterium]